jgi:hypothetical protein
MMGADQQKELVAALVKAECIMSWPRTQRDVCAMAARIDVTLYGPPSSEIELFDRARGIAAGLFGEAYDRADEGQRWDWIDMCERALRAASAGV